jgi:hypothetical protein
MAGEDIARCPSCSLLLTVIYDPDNLPKVPEEGGEEQSAPGGNDAPIAAH